MLVEFKVKNFKSYRDEQVFSMVADSSKRLEGNYFSPTGFDKNLLHSSVVYGANASGKSNLIAALSFVRNFVRSSADEEPSSKIPVESFLLSENGRQSPTEFELTFLHNGVRFQYGFVVNEERVLEEWLITYPRNSARTWYERTPSSETDGESEWYFGSYLKGEKTKLVPLVRPNVLFLSVAAKFNHEQLTPIYQWFRKKLQVLDAPPQILELVTLTILEKDIALADQIKKLLYVADVGIDAFDLQRVKRPQPAISINAPEELQPVFQSLENFFSDKESLEVQFTHRAEEGENGVQFGFENESLGTQRLFGLSGPLLMSLKSGSVLIIDEMDASLHPLLVQAIIGLYHNPTTNPKNAQLIFNTHDLTLLDSTILRRDQVWFTEKDTKGATYIYSLLDFKPRGTESFGRGYIQGRYGAIPIVGNILEVFLDGANSKA